MPKLLTYPLLSTLSSDKNDDGLTPSLIVNCSDEASDKVLEPSDKKENTVEDKVNVLSKKMNLKKFCIEKYGSKTGLQKYNNLIKS